MGNISYRVIRSTRRTLAIQIMKDGQVLVRSPYFVSGSRIAEFVKSKEDWIVKHQKKEIPQVQPMSQSQLQALAERAAAELPGRVAHYAARLGVTYGRITVRRQKTRWGSCSAKGNLNFNCLLMLAPPYVIDYVVIHELCHLKEMNHSPKFWAHVAQLCPEYKDCRKWLRENGPGLIAGLPHNE